MFNNKNKFRIRIFLIILSARTILFAGSHQFIDVKITKILDCNLFETKEGRLVQLSNVEAPVLADADSSVMPLAKRIKSYAEENILYSPLTMEIADSSEKIYKVHLFREYDLQHFNFNEYYLRYGFGFYRQEPPSEYSEKYFKAVQTACEKQVGLWGKGIYQPKQNPFYGRWRVMGGLLGGLDEDQNKVSAIPMINLNYRASKLITIFENKDAFFSFASELGSTLIFLNYVMIGPELRFKKEMYFNVSYGKLFFPLFGENDSLESFFNSCIGIMFYRTGLNFEFGYIRLTNIDEVNLFYIAFVVPLR